VCAQLSACVARVLSDDTVGDDADVTVCVGVSPALLASMRSAIDSGIDGTSRPVADFAAMQSLLWALDAHSARVTEHAHSAHETLVAATSAMTRLQCAALVDECSQIASVRLQQSCVAASTRARTEPSSLECATVLHSAATTRHVAELARTVRGTAIADRRVRIEQVCVVCLYASL
jgi:hypothetical protein